MFLLFPIGHEDSRVNRFPIVSVAIGLGCLLGFGLTWPRLEKEAEEIEGRVCAILSGVVESGGFDGFGEREQLKEKLEGSFKAGGIEAVLGTIEQMIARREIPLEGEERSALTAEIKEVRQLLGDTVFHRHGLVTSAPRPLAYLTHMFLHAGYLHLIFNLVFFALVGPTLEDLWGRIIYPVVYFASGLAAALGFTAVSGSLSIPMVGASGAIAGLMGAFLVAFTRTRIRMVGVIFIGFLARFVKFSAPAWVFLPLWIGWEIYQGSAQLATGGGGSGGVAHWAHIAGFFFGVGVPFAFWLSGLDRVLFPVFRAEEKAAAGGGGGGGFQLDVGYRRAVRLRDEGQWRDAEAELQSLAERYPNDPGPHRELAELHRREGDTAKWGEHLKAAVELAATAKSPETLELYETLRREFRRMTVSAECLYRVAIAFERAGQVNEAAEHLRKFLSLYPDYTQTVRAAVRLADLLAGTMGNTQEARAVLTGIEEKAAADPLWREEVAWRVRKLEKDGASGRGAAAACSPGRLVRTTR